MTSEHNTPIAPLEDSQFGVDFYSPVDSHRMSDRALKYELFVISLTFLILVMFELLTRIRIHSMQYLLVGSALVLFYLLLLSLAEHIGFSAAYACASLTVISLIGGYGKAVLGRGSSAIAVGLSLVMVYGFFFTLLQEQDYSLLIGSVGLTVILAAIMYLTRKFDWAAVNHTPEQETNSASNTPGA